MSATLLTQPAATKPAESGLPAAVSVPPRNVAVDAYRGLVMLLMMGEVMEFATVARAYPESLFWHVLAWNQTHVEWAGMSLHDTIQPGFTFLVGVALPYSIASRAGTRPEPQPAVPAYTLAQCGAHCAWYLPPLNQ